MDHLLSERALGDARKDIYHVVGSVFLVLVVECENIKTVRHKVSFEEPIHDEHLENYVGEADHLAKPVSEGIHVVLLWKQTSITVYKMISLDCQSIVILQITLTFKCLIKYSMRMPFFTFFSSSVRSPMLSPHTIVFIKLCSQVSHNHFGK